MTDLIQQHLAALKAERERVKRTMNVAQQQVNELSVHLLRLEGGIESCEALLAAPKTESGDNTEDTPPPGWMHRHPY